MTVIFLAGEMMKIKKRCFFVLVVTFVLTCLSLRPVSATIIFSGNFESYAAGSNLAGQGGWTGDTMSSSRQGHGLGSPLVTAHRSATAAQVAQLAAVDYRPASTTTPAGSTYAGGEFDNIVAIPIPEPSTVVLFGLGSIVLLVRRRR